MIRFVSYPKICLIVLSALLITAPAPAADLCQVPDNGSGTITLPPMGCQFTSPDEW